MKIKEKKRKFYPKTAYIKKERNKLKKRAL